MAKNFCGLLLEDVSSEEDRKWWHLSRASRTTLCTRGAKITLTSDFGRPYKDIVKHYKGYMLDEWLHFVEKFSVYLLTADLMDPRMWQMWTLLRCC